MTTKRNKPIEKSETSVPERVNNVLFNMPSICDETVSEFTSASGLQGWMVDGIVKKTKNYNLSCLSYIVQVLEEKSAIMNMIRALSVLASDMIS